MAMTCRRCNGKITEGRVAHVIRSTVVCNACKLPDEVGFREKIDAASIVAAATEPDPEEDGLVPGLTARQLQILVMATKGDVTRIGKYVSAYDRVKKVTRDSRGVVDVLRGAGLVYWEQVPPKDFRDRTTHWVLRLKTLGEKAMRQAMERGSLRG